MKMNLAPIAFTSSFCSMSFSMIMALVMSEFTGEEVLTQCLTVGPYLLGLGIGSALTDHLRAEIRGRTLWLLEWASVLLLPFIPVLQLLGVFLFLHLSPMGVSLDNKSAIMFLLSFNSVLSFFSGLLGGAQLPLILSEEKKLSEEVILTVNYLGPLVAGLTVVAFSSNATPMGMQLFIIGIVQLIGLFTLALMLPDRIRSMVLITVPLLAVTVVGHLYPRVEYYTVKGSYLRSKSTVKDLLKPGNLLNVIDKYADFERVRTSYQTIDVMIEPPEVHYGIPGNATVYLNRKPQFDLLTSALYHESMVYGAINLMKRTPKSVLILGAGDGLLLKEMRELKIPKVTMIELDRAMLEWSRTNPVVSTLNRGSLDHLPEGTEVVVDDAISFLRRNVVKGYDLILIDFPFPNGHDLAKLYSLEFYTMVKRSLSPDGLLVVDLPLYLNLDRELSSESKIVLKTMKTAGLANPYLFGPLAAFVAIAGDGRELAFDYTSFPPHLSQATYTNFLSPFGEEKLSAKEWDDIPVNTMFWPKEL